VWALCGEHATKYEFFHRGNKYSILPALSLDGILHLKVVENAVTGNIFCQFIEDLLPCMNEWPLPHSVLVVDNAAIHKVAGCYESTTRFARLERLRFSDVRLLAFSQHRQ
jgi:hypothetical protein